jgi:serine/threonine protein kinase
MVHQVLRERSIMSSIVTSNARYRSTSISISFINLSLFFHSVTLSLYHSAYSFMSTSTCVNIHDSNSPFQNILVRRISILYITVHKYSNLFVYVFYVVRISEMFVRMFSAFQSRQSLYIAMEFVQGGDCLSMLTTMIRCLFHPLAYQNQRTVLCCATVTVLYIL